MMSIFRPLIEFLTPYRGLNNSIFPSLVENGTRIFIDDEGTKHFALFVANLISGRRADFTFSNGDKGFAVELRRVLETCGRDIGGIHEYRKSDDVVVVGIETTSLQRGRAGRSIPKKLARDSTQDEGTQRWRPSPEDFDPHHIARFCFSAFSTSSEFLPSLETIILIPYILFKRPALSQRAPSRFALILSSS